MNHKMLVFKGGLAAVLILSLITSSCSAVVPVTKIETGPTQTAAIQVPLPENSTGSIELDLEFLTGKLKLSPGAAGDLVTGMAAYNAVDLAPKLAASGLTSRLSTGDQEIEGIPKFEDELVNEWDLKLADTPMSLKIHTGPYTGTFELGGLSLERLEISEIGSDLTAAFSQPNHVPMSAFVLNTGGSNMTLTGLANANFEQMSLESGAGTYTLSFDGELQREAGVDIDTGLSTLTLIVPAGTNARVIYDGGLSSVTTVGDWRQEGQVYTLAGSGPLLDIKIKMGLGSLNLKAE
jgi:hypothetical protein